MIKHMMMGVALLALGGSSALAEVSLDQLKDPHSKDGLNMAMVEARQKEMRSQGVSNDVSMKILGVAQQRSMIKNLLEQQAALVEKMPKKKKEQVAVHAEIAKLDAQIDALKTVVSKQLHDIDAELHLIPEQLAQIKGVDHQAKMRETARSKSDPRVRETMAPALPPRPNEVH